MLWIISLLLSLIKRLQVRMALKREGLSIEGMKSELTERLKKHVEEQASALHFSDFKPRPLE